MSDYRRYLGRRALVFTDELTFDGILARVGRETVTLEGAAAVNDTGQTRPVDGEVLVPKLRINWVQAV